MNTHDVLKYGHLWVDKFYGHKREHCAQIAVFRDQFKKEK